TNLNIMSMKPLRGNGLFIFDPSLVFTIIDNMFGGDGRFHTRVEGRDFTLTEQRIVSRMLEVVLNEFNAAWAPVFPLRPEYVRSEMHTQFANIANPSEIVVTTSFSIELGSGGGMFHFCIPYSPLEPIRDLLYSSMQGDQVEPDKRWVNMLKHQVQMAEVELTTNLAETRLTVADIMELRAGDVIPLDIKSTLETKVDNVPVFECSYGTSSGQYALKVERVLALENLENMVEQNSLDSLLKKEAQRLAEKQEQEDKAKAQ
ncbi:MAG: flagellar motor switch protein FliM, partial [Limnobacter sp.]|nr:flagellar motor switch protein FliM [Limnobacter sp.]